MKLTDGQLVGAVHKYRQQPLVADKFGPVNLEEFARYLDLLYGQTISKSGLSVRLRRLVDRGYLRAEYDASDGRLYTFTLALTEDGRKLMEENGDGVLEGS